MLIDHVFLVSGSRDHGYPGSGCAAASYRKDQLNIAKVTKPRMEYGKEAI